MFSVAVSPCSNPDLTLEECLQKYGALGYRRIELFTGWTRAAADPLADPRRYLRLARDHGFTYSSLHLPSLSDDPASVSEAAWAARFASDIGCRCVIVKAEHKGLFAEAGRQLLDAIERLPVIPVLQNHKGSAISTLDDYLAALRALDDQRIFCTLEVGHFHSVGVPWRQAYDALKDRIRHVHVKDQIGAQSVPFGTGEIDLPGLFATLVEDGYDGDVVVEMEVADKKNTLRYLGDALRYIEENTPGWTSPG